MINYINKSGFLNILIAIIVFAVLAGGGVYFVARNQNQVSVPQPAPIPAPVSTIPSGWRTFSNPEYSISYPSNFDVHGVGYAISERGVNSQENISFPVGAFAIPKTTFGGAWIEIHTGNDYSFVAPGIKEGNATIVNINGTEFQKASYHDGAAGTSRTYEVYNTTKHNPSYNLTLIVQSRNGAYDPSSGVDYFDSEKAFTVLRQVVNTFKFTAVATKPPLEIIANDTYKIGDTITVKIKNNSSVEYHFICGGLDYFDLDGKRINISGYNCNPDTVDLVLNPGEFETFSIWDFQQYDS